MGHKGSVCCLQALPDGRIVSGSDDNTIRIWTRNADGTWGHEVLTGHEDSVLCLQALPDGRIVSGSKDGTIRIWDGETVGSVPTAEQAQNAKSSILQQVKSWFRTLVGGNP